MSRRPDQQDHDSQRDREDEHADREVDGPLRMTQRDADWRGRDHQRGEEQQRPGRADADQHQRSRKIEHSDPAHTEHWDHAEYHGQQPSQAQSLPGPGGATGGRQHQPNLHRQVAGEHDHRVNGTVTEPAVLRGRHPDVVDPDQGKQDAEDHGAARGQANEPARPLPFLVPNPDR